MGIYFSRLVDSLLGVKEMRVLVLSLEGTSKTTILPKLKLGEVATTIPTIDFSIETVEHKNISLTAQDLGKDSSIRGSIFPKYPRYHLCCRS
jgi:ADP-ribosylation factor protein 1